MTNIRVVAIEGGGFTHSDHPALDAYCLDQIAAPRPRIGFIGSASNDDPERVARFHARFVDVTAAHVHLAMSLNAQALAERLNGLDMIHVGGGDTEALVAAWRMNGRDRVLMDAARRGLILSGVSAGAVCWFDRFLFSSGTGPMRPLQGLGLIRGGACPHYSSEPDRRPALHAAVLSGDMPATLALDDGVAVLLDPAGPVAVFSARPPATAYRVARTDRATVEETPLPFDAP